MQERSTPSLSLSIILTAAAGGMGWGIRGQYGHESGAMLAGVLVGLVLVLMFCRGASSLFAARAVAMTALGVAIGGAMTYGQTVGLMHNPEVVGNWAAARWGFLGLFIKGGIWIGFAAAFLGIALGGVRYRPVELALLLLSMIFFYFLGHQLLNTPYDVANKSLPYLYFSESWHWNPDGDLKPRHERWGGFLFALAALWIYAGWIRRDRLARWLTLWGVVGGGLGFACGQCIQAYHAWNRDAEIFQEGVLSKINWWNMMETTFGLIFGAFLALGLWLNRNRIHEPERWDAPEITRGAEWALVIIHVAALLAWNFGAFNYFDSFADLSIPMVLIPTLAVWSGRLWPYLVTLPIVALPIAGKTLRELCYPNPPAEPVHGETIGWIALVAVPLIILVVAAIWLARDGETRGTAGRFARWSLVLATWTYFWLNFAFFRFPWPWSDWTIRTANGIIFSVCAIGLTALALFLPKTAAPTNESVVSEA